MRLRELHFVFFVPITTNCQNFPGILLNCDDIRQFQARRSPGFVHMLEVFQVQFAIALINRVLLVLTQG